MVKERRAKTKAQLASEAQKRAELEKAAKVRVEEEAVALAEKKGATTLTVEAEPQPGTIKNKYKVPWTRKQLDEAYGLCYFTPEETMPVTVSGIRFQLIAGVEMQCPTIVRDTYKDYRRRTMRAGQTLPSVSGYETTVGLGAGALPAEETVEK